MATDVKSNAGLDTGAAQNGRITVMGNRNNRQFQDPPAGVQTFTITGYDLATVNNGTDLSLRFDEKRYYTGDADA